MQVRFIWRVTPHRYCSDGSVLSFCQFDLGYKGSWLQRNASFGTEVHQLSFLPKKGTSDTSLENILFLGSYRCQGETWGFQDDFSEAFCGYIKKKPEISFLLPSFCRTIAVVESSFFYFYLRNIVELFLLEGSEGLTNHNTKFQTMYVVFQEQRLREISVVSNSTSTSASPSTLSGKSVNTAAAVDLFAVSAPTTNRWERLCFLKQAWMLGWSGSS